MTKMFALRPTWVTPLVVLVFTLSQMLTLAQTCGPDCRALNLSITSTVDNEFHSKVLWGDLIPNFACAAPISYELQTLSGATVAKGSSDDVGNEVYLIIDNPCGYLREGLMIVISNSLGSCSNLLTFKKGMLNFQGRHFDVSCLDPQIEAPAKVNYPLPYFSCDGPVIPEWVADWPVAFDCVVGSLDTAKIIYREWAAYDKEGNRYSSIDTIIVFRLPQLDAPHLYCVERDTLYCGVSNGFGPYLLLGGITRIGQCDTLRFIDVSTEGGKIGFATHALPKACGLQLHLDTTKFASGCEEIWKLDLEIKQECPGGVNLAQCFVPPGGQIQPLDAAGTYWRCTFWVYNIDTLAPLVTCDYSHYADQSILWPASMMDGSSRTHCFDTPSNAADTAIAPVVMVSTNAHDCSAIAAIPGLCISDDWSGINQVKATIEGIGTYLLNRVDTCDDGSERYEYEKSIELPLLEIPYRVLYEVSDGCYNVDSVYCYILVKDGTKPIAVADKGVTVSLSGKTVWVEANTFEEGSYDNCAISMLLARRTDWSTAGVDLCDDADSICSYHDVTLRLPNLETDKEVNEIEAHYAKTIKWFREDQAPCASVLLNAWQFGLIEAAYQNCDEGHLTHEELIEIFSSSCKLDLLGSTESFGCGVQSNYETLLKSAAEIGGGWGQEVPFTCADACQNVTVEILVMDYWCNWNRAWTQVKVEDRSPIRVLQDVDENVEISCNTFIQERYAFDGGIHALNEIVDKAVEGSAEAMGVLDEVFGGYDKVWVNTQGDWVDIDGNVVPLTTTLHDSICYCKEVRKQIAIYDDHQGMIWVDSIYTECGYKDEVREYRRGVVAVNCAQNVQCRQSVWEDLDHCGQGYIYRKFEIWSGCPVPDPNHATDTLRRIQKIYVGNNCPLSKAMFDVPGDIEVHACGVEYDPLGSGNVIGAADPSITGYPQYKFDDDCRVIGVAHEDKVFKIVGGDAACYKIVRTWYFADWCQTGAAETDGWWQHSDLITDTCVQKIILIDTVPPVCLITGPVEDGGTISIAGCVYDFFAEIDISDECGVIEYAYQIFKDQEVVANGYGQLDTEVLDHVTVGAGSLSDGTYSLRVRTTDQCQNEGFCNYQFTLEAGKKPSPVCLTSLTVELGPEDLDNDGTIDTAMAKVWAKEFDVSSSAPCGYSDDDLKFYIKRINADNDFETLDTTVDLDYLELGCEDIGTQNVRMWVLSPTGSADFCDVYLIVQANSGGCPMDTTMFSTISGSIVTMDGKGVKNVTVTGAIKEATIEAPQTNEEGLYDMLFGFGESVIVTPFKDGDDINGVKTNDILALANHINNSAPFTDPYLRIAADVNFDHVINAGDLLLLRNLVINNVSAWPDGDSWRFVTSDYAFVSAKPEAEDFPESKNLLLDAETVTADFIAMKIGDLNLDRNVQSTGRSGDAIVMSVSDQQYEIGEPVTFTPVFEDVVSLRGLQFELHFDANKLRFEGVRYFEELPMSDENFGLRLVEDGVIYCSFSNEHLLNIKNQLPLFSFVFEAKESGVASESVAFVGDRLSAEVYPDVYVNQPLSLRFVESYNSVTVGQNIPNPFRDVTMIPLEFVEPETVHLLVTDLQGKVILQRKIVGIAGKQEIEISSQEINAPGIYYYSIIGGSSKTTRKMILLK